MRKYVYEISAFVLICYIWFAILPEIFGISLPTGGWDWLTFIATTGSVFFALRGIQFQLKSNNENVMKQQQLSVVPCLNVDTFSAFDENSKNNSFRFIKDSNSKILNDGYRILRNINKKLPDNFTPHINIKFKNSGLSTAFQVEVYLHKLDSVDGLENLNQISMAPIEDFYNKVKYSNYEYYENSSPLLTNWLISPQYCLSNNNDEFNLVFDTSNIELEYHNIFKINFEDIYGNKYNQLLYLYFDKKGVATYPISKIMKNN